MLCFNKGNIAHSLVAYGVLLTEMRLKWYFECHFQKLYKRDKVFCTNNKVEGPNSW